jgi:hypothetical protein
MLKVENWFETMTDFVEKEREHIGEEMASRGKP